MLKDGPSFDSFKDSIEQKLHSLVPCEIFQISTRRALRSLMYSLSFALLGYFILFYSNWFYLPVAWIFLGLVFAGFHSITLDCQRGSFSRYRIVNDVVGIILSLPLLIPFESLRLQYKLNSKYIEEKLEKFASGKAWWMSYIPLWFSAIVNVRSIYVQGYKTQIILSNGILYIFISILSVVLLYFFGIWGLFKFWLVPWVFYQLWMSSFITNAYKIQTSGDKTLKISITMPKQYPKFLEFITNDINFVLSGTRSLMKLSDSLGSIPNHNLRKFYNFIINDSYLKNFYNFMLTDNEKKFNWLNGTFLISTPLIALYGFYSTPLYRETVILSFLLYCIGGLSMSVGYHRLFCHNSFKTNSYIKAILLFFASSTFQGSCLKWCRNHKLHHIHLGTKRDPYKVHRGFLYGHILWLLWKEEEKNDSVEDNTKLAEEKEVEIFLHNLVKEIPIVAFQDRYYFILAPLSGILFPTLIAGFGWGDFWGGLYFATILRIVIIMHSTFSLNSFAHYFGKYPYNEKKSTRDNWLLSLLTFGEGNLNFHHEFPSDHRNGYKIFSFDPTKWVIKLGKYLGVFYNTFSYNEEVIKRTELEVKDRVLETEKNKIEWGKNEKELIEMTMEEVQEKKQTQCLIIIRNVVHDVTGFIDNHPGGAKYFRMYNGLDASEAFFGRVYRHSNAAMNLLKKYAIARLVVKQTNLEERL